MTLLLPERPLVKRHLLAATIGRDDVFILAEDRIWLWKNRGLGALLPSLDGTRTLSDLFDCCESGVSPPEIIHLLNQLNARGLLAEGPAPPAAERPEAEQALWHALGVGDSPTVDRVWRSRVRLRAAGPHDTGVLGDALAAIGVAVSGVAAVGNGDGGARGGASLEVVVTDHYFQPVLTEINAAALGSGSPWMAVKLVGRTLWIGPIFHPGRTGCLACLQDRLQRNRQVEDHVVRKTGDASYYATSRGATPAMTRLGATWAAQEIALWLAGRAERLEGKLLAVQFGPDGLDVSTHVLVRRPQCPTCGVAPSLDRTLPMTIQRRPAASPGDGGFRLETPEATLRRLEHHISPITGVVTSLTDMGRDPEGLLHCYGAEHSFTLGPDTTYWLRQSLRSRTGGKGATAAQARVSAVCEAIERYCGVYRDEVPRVRATYDALGRRAVHPSACLNFSDRQYARRDELNADARQGFFHLVPKRFPEDLEIDWVPLWSLTHEETRYLPAAFCYYGHPDVGRHFYCTGDANGCAAGTVLEEAVLQAFLELVERDSAAMWWYNRVARPLLDLDSSADPYVARLRERYARQGRELWALDLTSDLGIPVVAGVSRRVDGPTDDLLIGLGCHLDPALALRRALVEVNQFLPAVSRRHPDGRTRYAWPDDVAVRFWKRETLATQPQLVPQGTLPRRTLADLPGWSGGDLYDGLQACLGVARRQGLNVMVLDQTRPDIELAVARVVVPGLRHFWRRLGPGRLYDVPVQLGWLAAPTAEEDLNPTSIFF